MSRQQYYLKSYDTSHAIWVYPAHELFIDTNLRVSTRAYIKYQTYDPMRATTTVPDMPKPIQYGYLTYAITLCDIGLYIIFSRDNTPAWIPAHVVELIASRLITCETTPVMFINI